jgi:hypothetical protein
MDRAINSTPLICLHGVHRATLSLLLLYRLQEFAKLYTTGLHFASDVNAGHVYAHVSTVSVVREILRDFF